MADDHIGELRIRIRTATATDEQVLRREAEQFARSVLERALQLLEERAPGRRIFLRQLPLRWHLTETALGDPSRMEALAMELAATLENSLPPASDTPSPSAEAVVFRDEAHCLASYLLSRARGEQAWFHRSLEQGAGFEAVSTSRHAALAQVLATLPPRELQALEKGVRAEEHAAGTPGTFPVSPPHLADTYRALPAPARALALRIEARRIAGPGAPTVEVARTVEAVRGARQAQAPAPDGQVGVPDASTGLSREAVDVTEGALPPGERPGPSHSRDVQEVSPVEAELPPPPTETTRFGGLFFLLNPLLELEIPEALWKACLPEGEVLSYLARELLGSRDDGAATLLGGAPPPERPPELLPEQQAEFTSNIATQLMAALPRRGLASLPEAVVGLHEHPAGRLICAAALGSPFALFAWPAESRDAITTGLGQLLATWPASARLHGSPALATLAPAGRLRPLPREYRQRPLHLPGAATPAAAALLAQAIGAPCQLLLSRAGEQVDSAEGFTSRFLARPARVSWLDGQMRVTFSGADLDVALRKPGLDRDPGWIAWLERTVRFEFETDAL